jgi:hypothetical protein
MLRRENLGQFHSKTGLAYVLVRMIVEPQFAVFGYQGYSLLDYQDVSSVVIIETPQSGAPHGEQSEER